MATVKAKKMERCASCDVQGKRPAQSGMLWLCPPCNARHLAAPPRPAVDRIIMRRTECKLADVRRANRVRGTWVLVDVYADASRVAVMGMMDFERASAALDMYARNRFVPSADMWAELDAAA